MTRGTSWPRLRELWDKSSPVVAQTKSIALTVRLPGQCFAYLRDKELNARDAIRSLAEVAGDILIQPDVVNHHACAGDSGNLALQKILHSIIGHVAVEA